MFKKAMVALDKAKGKVSVAATMAVATAQAFSVQAMADLGTGSAKSENLVLGIGDIVVKLFPLIGVFFILAGVFKLFMAYRNNQPEDQSTAAKDIVIGAVCVAFWAFAWAPIKSLIA